MIMDSFTEIVANELALGRNVRVHHLPHYVRFSAQVSNAGGGMVTRSYNPPSLSSLAGTLVVANASPAKVQRYID
jgi:hypothetical protein